MPNPRSSPATPATDEFGLIARYFAPLAAGEAGAFGLTDDAAVLAVAAGESVVVTCDTLVAGVHFLADDPADGVGVKALAVNLSDLAAMGARPFGYLLSAGLPVEWPRQRLYAWLDGFTAGLRRLQQRWGVCLVGGDTVGVPGPVCLTITALGRVGPETVLRRGAARPGDDVYVSGSIGDAALGLRVLRGELPWLAAGHRRWLIGRYREPQPRVSLGPRLIGLAHAAIDVSDGLIADLGHVCAASGVAASIAAGQVPLSDAARAALAREPGLLATVLSGGDDYELVFTAPPSRAAALASQAREVGVPITRIGRIRAPDAGAAGGTIRVDDAQGRPLTIENAGFRHF